MTLGRSVHADELNNKDFWAELRKDLETVFAHICESETPDLEISLEDDAIMAFYPLFQSINDYAKQTADFSKLLHTYVNSYSRSLSEQDPQ